MATLFPNSISFAAKNVFGMFPKHNQPCMLRHKKSNVVCCQGNSKSHEGSDDAVKRMETTTKSVSLDMKRCGIDSSPVLDVHDDDDGIGIVKFLQGKTFLITGATGFLAKVLVEKILRTMPDTGKIYLIIQARNEEAAIERLKIEIVNAEIFDLLKQKHGRSYQNFMLSKLVPVVGNLCESDIGMEKHIANGIAKEVDIIVNSAATTNFHERYDVSINTNTRGPCHLIEFAKKCSQLKLFLQVSTAYVSRNGLREGREMEKLFDMGDVNAQENFSSKNPSATLPVLDIENEIQLALNADQEALKGTSMDRYMKNLGFERASKYGWENTYVFTKAMGEMIIDNERGDVPVVIIRPSIIESTYRDPFPGWIEGNRMIDPLVQHYGKGYLSGFVGNPNCVIDIVPIDMVVNATLAAMARHGTANKTEINVYHIASSVVNPLTLQELFAIFCEHFKSSPLIDSNGGPINVQNPAKLYKSIEELRVHLSKDTVRLTAMASSNSKRQKKIGNFIKKLEDQIIFLATLYEPYFFYRRRFDCSNTQKLMEALSEEEKIDFGIDADRIEWKDYISNIHIPGLRRHVIKEKVL